MRTDSSFGHAGPALALDVMFCWIAHRSVNLRSSYLKTWSTVLYSGGDILPDEVLIYLPLLYLNIWITKKNHAILNFKQQGSLKFSPP
jgi:hypothetical protein